MFQAASVVIRPEPEHHLDAARTGAGATSVTGATRATSVAGAIRVTAQDTDESRPLAGIRAPGEDLLELVDDKDRAPAGPFGHAG